LKPLKQLPCVNRKYNPIAHIVSRNKLVVVVVVVVVVVMIAGRESTTQLAVWLLGVLFGLQNGRSPFLLDVGGKHYF
jgi:Flp pilus assembly protein protease CpaA